MRILLLWLALICAVPVAAESDVRLFGGWIVGCSNENICTAIHLAGDAADATPASSGAVILQVRHYPHRNAIPEITLFDQANPTLDAGLKPRVAVVEVHYSWDKAECGCKNDCPTMEVLYRARSDGKGGYRFDDEDVRSGLHGLRFAMQVRLTLGDAPIVLFETAHLDEALAFFDREQELADTPGALVLSPGNVMYDYLHPRTPEAGTVITTSFTSDQLEDFLAEYPPAGPGEAVAVVSNPPAGQVQIIRTFPPGQDCGVFERWGHVGRGSDFVLVERREMPVCVGIDAGHWIQTYRADIISPEDEK